MAESNRRPLIGVTGPANRGRTAWYFTRLALRRAGARACRITPAVKSLPTLQGLVIGGGDDIDPLRYGQSTTLTTRLDGERDALELRLLGYAETHSLPVLGICRGAQMINVFYGGTLHQDIRTRFENIKLRRTVLARKQIELLASSRLMEIMQQPRILVNSLHNQAVDRLADGLVVAASDSDGLVQAIETASSRFLIGVQWHPEYLPQWRIHQRLFRALANTARAV